MSSAQWHGGSAPQGQPQGQPQMGQGGYGQGGYGPGYGQHYGAPGYGQPYGGYTPPVRKQSTATGGIVMLAGALASILGVFLPWGSISGITVNGIGKSNTAVDMPVDLGDAGPVVLFCAGWAALMALLFLVNRKLAPLWAALAILPTLLTGFIGFGNMVTAGDYGVSVGIGLWLIGLGAVATIIGTILGLALRKPVQGPTPAR